MHVSRASLARALFCALVASTAAQADVFINELHYDNDGTDANERFEIAGTAGTSLTGWKVLLYNGGDGTVYSTINLSGTLPTQCNGHGTLAFNATGLQNGSPDGLALIDAGNAVKQFISYEGVFNATSGTASGRTSVDMGVSESTGVTSTQSLQLKGSGTLASNFTWSAASASSFGACNVGQTFTGGADAAPTVSSTSPANGATAVAASSNITVNFSEAVTTTASWASVACTSSGSHPGTTTGTGTTRTFDPTTDFSAGESCTVTVAASGVSDTDGTVTPMAANHSFSFTVAGAPPTTVLQNDVPVSGLSGGAATELRYTLVVPAGASNLVFTTTGGTGDADLYVRLGSAPTTTTYTCRSWVTGNNESCAVTATSGTWHVLVRGYTAFSGLTLKGAYSAGTTDTAPTVSGTSPANGATNIAVASNITVNFSESVTTGSSWFTLNCASSGSHPAVTSGTGATRTLNPNTDFSALETCTLTVLANQVSDIDGTVNPMASNHVISFTTSTASTGYYASVVTTSAAQLRATLHPVIDDHTKFPYTASTTDVWDILDRADQDPLNSSRILDVYKNASYAKAGGGNTFYNREHSWPKSLGFPDDTATNYPYTDTHMLMASDIAYNSARGNLPFANCGAGSTEFTTQVYNGAGGAGQSNFQCAAGWQTWNKLKGNMARAMFYMDLRYEGGTHGVTGAAEPDLRLTDTASQITMSTGNASVAYMGLLSVLLQWHAADPVDAAEQLRNDVIYSYQGNRNPFVDNPQWVACIYQNVCP